MASGFFRGTTADQDARFGNAEKRLMKKMKFASILSEKVDLRKVNMDVIKRWITDQLVEFLGFEEEVTIGLVINYLESDTDAKKLQLQCTEFIGKNKASTFVTELWALLVDAQRNPSGIPTAFIEAKKKELAERTRKEEEEGGAVAAAMEAAKMISSEA
ncbi:serine/arginine repetitive matrix protein 1 [Nannochloropsis gaditana CCMP526]|uniref:serine/arginine repetitive matrix protein 1 n=1 Tax=Nannochloropsis gaditana (strain CCMP526) TaxID=1093141 RepID=UPI00029F5BA3|nr:serine/arginine repetitive matrix protein 1 [Nannochloropsis gaditana CCMP526]EKU20303.1 serine/arginine repetitive matrix protein 1 [Nannochloropsis gaditana CCMP526]|eukprot:XP_005856056.1 serine/arginine repetitive matrix protein 1 [Nannochloropsis gaditana CCMP526]